MDTGANERDLVKAAQRDPAAFGALYDRYVQPIYGFVFRRVDCDVALAQDLTAATFEKALRGLPRYRWQGVSFGAWVFQIARNEIAQHYRHRSPAPLRDDAIDSSSNPTPDTAIDLANGLARLSSEDRELLECRFFDDLPTPLLAEILGISPNALYVRLHRALERLRQAMGAGEVSYAD